MKLHSETQTTLLTHLYRTSTSPCIMVVEDDPDIANMLEDALTAWGYEVRVATNGQEGLDIITTQSVDGILLDMHMPIMDGRTMLDELRWAGYQLPVWMMSSGSDVPTLRQLLHEGAQGFIIKPFQLQSLERSCAQAFSPSKSSD